MVATATAATLLSAAGLALSYAGYRQNQKAIAASNRAQKLQAERERKQAIRQTILQRSAIQQQAQVLGVTDTSGFAGGLSSISSQLGSNLGYGNMQSGISSQISNLKSSASTLSGLGGIAFNVGTNYEEFKTGINTIKSKIGG